VVARHVLFSAPLIRGTRSCVYTSSTACRSLRQCEGRINPINARSQGNRGCASIASTSCRASKIPANAVRLPVLSLAVRNKPRMAAWLLVSSKDYI
jgi:hypothetical protein